VNYKRKSRRRFILVVRWRSPPVSSEFRGLGFEHPKPPLRYATGYRDHSTVLNIRKFKSRECLSMVIVNTVIYSKANLLLILHSFDRLAAFHLELLQTILSAALFLATCYKYCSQGLLTAFFPGYCSFKDVYYKLVMPNYMPYS